MMGCDGSQRTASLGELLPYAFLWKIADKGISIQTYVGTWCILLVGVHLSLS